MNQPRHLPAVAGIDGFIQDKAREPSTFGAWFASSSLPHIHEDVEAFTHPRVAGQAVAPLGDA